jgi:hypothetical protein
MSTLRHHAAFAAGLLLLSVFAVVVLIVQVYRTARGLPPVVSEEDV